jgi:hypothetical protein
MNMNLRNILRYEDFDSFKDYCNELSKKINENKNNLNKKRTILNFFICHYGSTNWKKNVDILNNIDFPTSIDTSKGHHSGLAVQVLLDLDLDKAKEFSEHLLKLFEHENPTIVISEVDVIMKNKPIGEYFDKDLWEPGRYFDKLVSEGMIGIFIY